MRNKLTKSKSKSWYYKPNEIPHMSAPAAAFGPSGVCVGDSYQQNFTIPMYSNINKTPFLGSEPGANRAQL